MRGERRSVSGKIGPRVHSHFPASIFAYGFLLRFTAQKGKIHREREKNLLFLGPGKNAPSDTEGTPVAMDLANFGA